jgi:hypothetical protein
MTRTKIIGTLFVPVIALSVFANQLYRQAAYDLSAWKGGGTGMIGSGLNTPDGYLLPPLGAGRWP